MKIVIIDYGAGNIRSLLFAFNRLGYKAVVSNEEGVIRSADKVVFPGVGEASSAMRKLKASGLDVVIPELTQPVLGICLGMQLLCRRTAENNTNGLGIFDTEIIRFTSVVRVPQIGWNTIYNLESKLFRGIDENEYMYQVHSYYAPLCENTIATTCYEHDYSAALQKDNFYGVQFHPEKSSEAGEVLLKNFVTI